MSDSLVKKYFTSGKIKFIYETPKDCFFYKKILIGLETPYIENDYQKIKDKLDGDFGKFKIKNNVILALVHVILDGQSWDNLFIDMFYELEDHDEIYFSFDYDYDRYTDVETDKLIRGLLDGCPYDKKFIEEAKPVYQELIGTKVNRIIFSHENKETDIVINNTQISLGPPRKKI